MSSNVRRGGGGGGGGGGSRYSSKIFVLKGADVDTVQNLLVRLIIITTHDTGVLVKITYSIKTKS